ncbi:hypothetical protein [Kitasatospora phosalacinea]|uniref:Secreted protein n=1 Tax=Kitasatospora phosalacinea TaxID=2065 RepID=A0ABW6GDR1_9ACTN
MTERTPQAEVPTPAGRTAARWTVLCALLLGLFLMHGSPASATGCHPAQPPRTAGAIGTAETAETAAHPGHRPALHHPALHRPAVSTPLPHGSSASACVSTPARDRLLLTAPGAALPPAAPRLPFAGPPCSGAERGGRAPPGGGRELLLMVCVARS